MRTTCCQINCNHDIIFNYYRLKCHINLPNQCSDWRDSKKRTRISYLCSLIKFAFFYKSFCDNKRGIQSVNDKLIYTSNIAKPPLSLHNSEQTRKGASCSGALKTWQWTDIIKNSASNQVANREKQTPDKTGLNTEKRAFLSNRETLTQIYVW